jgi:gluconate 2-dehydrogenase gamma chain
MNNPFFDQKMAQPQKLNGGVSRRQFVQGMAGASVLLPISASALNEAAKALVDDSDKDPWFTLGLVQQLVLPSDGNGPSASDINALAFLRAVTEQPQLEADSKAFIFNGVNWVNDFAMQSQQKHFGQLSVEQQRTLLATVAKSTAGENWLSMHVRYIFEALLSSPAYGSNIDQIGWQWLQHSGGFPQPPQDKLWFNLEPRR